MPPPPTSSRDLRVGDADRAAAAQRLSAHAAAGRLDVEELERRLDRTHAAVFARELAALEADLPGPRPQRRASPWPVAVVVVVALAILASVALGRPVVLPVLAALVLWRRQARHPHRPRGRIAHAP